MLTLSSRPKLRLRAAGFTLIELALVLVVIAVLATIAYPSFHGVLIKSRRVEARTALMNLQQAQERWRSQHGRYAPLHELGQPRTTPSGRYQLEVRDPGAYRYELVARATGGQASDTACRVMRVLKVDHQTLYTSGESTEPSNRSGAANACWPS